MSSLDMPNCGASLPNVKVELEVQCCPAHELFYHRGLLLFIMKFFYDSEQFCQEQCEWFESHYDASC